MASYQQRLDTLKAIAREAGDYMLAQVGQVRSIETKTSASDWVTNVDVEVDTLIRQRLSEAYPGEPLITEETFDEGTDTLDLDHAWIVDPIDGTTSFAHGFPFFSVSIAYAQQGHPVVGVVYDPSHQELFSAIRGQGVWLNGQPIHVTSTDQLARSLWITGFPYTLDEVFEQQMKTVKRVLEKTHDIRRMGSAALDLAYVAAGRADGFWEYALSPWDIAAGMLLVQEAGGITTNLKGEALSLTQRHQHILAANEPLHHQLRTECLP